MKTITLIFSSLLLVASNATAAPRYYFNQIGVSNLTGNTISNLEVQVGKHELTCDTVNNNGYCHTMFGKRPYPQEPIEMSWKDSDGKQQKQELNPGLPATLSPGGTLKLLLDIQQDNSVKWDLRQDGFRN
jgi:hypothetical protein